MAEGSKIREGKGSIDRPACWSVKQSRKKMPAANFESSYLKKKKKDSV